MSAHAEDVDSTVDELFHEETHRQWSMADELVHVVELTFDDPETPKAAEDVNAAFQSMISRFEASGLAKAAKEADDRMDALNGPLAKEFGKGLAASSKLLSAYEESGCAKARRKLSEEGTIKGALLASQSSRRGWCVITTWGDA